ncbi:MAG: MFS transporter [Candidatus Eisenbacteria bacterium]|nr:MFS transporter [Candidatus Eisenbacteria bacterium]
MPSDPALPHTPAAPDAGDPGAGRRNVLALGWASLFTDISTEMIVPVLPAFVTSTLRASVASLGVIEGVAECTATVLRIFSGWLSDRIGRRKPFMLFGYGLSTAAKGVMGLAGSWGAVLALRFSDRVGKGLRNPPRDALIADSVPAARLGWAFGLHRAMDSIGAAIGPLVAYAMLRAFQGELRRIFVLAALPAVLAMIVLALFVRAPRRAPAQPRSLGAELGGLGAPVYRFLAVAIVFSLGGSSMAFVLLRAGQAGLGPAGVPLVYALYNVVYASLSWPIGAWSDTIGRRPLLIAAYALFAACYALLAWQATAAVVIAAFLGLGVHSALLEGSQRTMLADLVAKERRGTAYGLYYAGVGATLLPSSIVAGWLWDRFGPPVTFAVGGALASLAALLFLILLPARDERRDRPSAA